MDRVWLDWDQPCLPAAAEWLRSQSTTDAQCVDCRGVVCVLPGRRAGRQWLSELVRQCEAEGRLLLPPRILTPGAMVDVLLGVQDPMAGAVSRRFAWMIALQRCDPDTRAALLPSPPATDDIAAWFDFGAALERVHDELAGQRCSCGDVIEQIEHLDLASTESERWRALEQIQRCFQDALASSGMVDPHRQREAALSRGDAIAPDQLVLIATPELNSIQRAVVERFADRTTILVHAPESLQDRFDEFGCLRPDAWHDVTLRVPDESLVLCDQPRDQVREVLKTVAGFGGRYAAEQITVGVGEETLIDPLKRAGAWAGLSFHAATGSMMRQSGPWRLLRAIADWRVEPSFASFAALLRHPDLERRLKTVTEHEGEEIHQTVHDWLTLLDDYFSDHLDQRFSGEWLGEPEHRERLAAIHGAVIGLLAPLAGDARTPAAWSEAILDVLRDVYGTVEASSSGSTPTSDACLILRDQLAAWRQLPETLQPTLSAATALDLLLASSRDEALSEDVRDEQIELLGWLELPLDPAPALIVTGVNDGAIPQSVQGDAFLPDSLRQRLGLMNNRRRYARDAYVLETLLHGRESVTLLTGRRSGDGDPLVPSRLLMADDPERVHARVKVLCEAPAPVDTPLPAGLVAPAADSAFVVPPLPADLPDIDHLAVTDFRRYLACPYRFALGRALRLRSKADDAEELDAGTFGSLAHDVLNAFGSDPDIRASDDEVAIGRFLDAALDHKVQEDYGASPPPAVQVQIARLRQRLEGFAVCQAALRQQGWAIRDCEKVFDATHVLELDDGDSMPITGAIDRIDVHERDGRWRIIDYKTSDTATPPMTAHVGQASPGPDDELEWRDLQLPLYRYLVQRDGVSGTVELGYLVLPRDPRAVAFQSADWSPQQLEAAITCARNVATRVRRREFPINPDYDPRRDDFARLCHTTVFRKPGSEPGEDDA